uniref:Uncharacterized protein n=1 Tax=Anguilla anguilla TaxID=7936 RepID=A0A0E9WBF8_ANGAN
MRFERRIKCCNSLKTSIESEKCSSARFLRKDCCDLMVNRRLYFMLANLAVNHTHRTMQ